MLDCLRRVRSILPEQVLDRWVVLILSGVSIAWFAPLTFVLYLPVLDAKSKRQQNR